jgi:hypothetical protein
MSASDFVLYFFGIAFSVGFIAAGAGLIIKDQMRKRNGEPRPHEVWEAQRNQRIRAEKELVEKYGK